MAQSCHRRVHGRTITTYAASCLLIPSLVVASLLYTPLDVAPVLYLCTMTSLLSTPSYLLPFRSLHYGVVVICAAICTTPFLFPICPSHFRHYYNVSPSASWRLRKNLQCSWNKILTVLHFNWWGRGVVDVIMLRVLSSAQYASSFLFICMVSFH